MDFLYRLCDAINCWETFLASQKSVDNWIRDAKSLMSSSRHVDSIENVATHQKFFEEPADEVFKVYLKSAQDLEQFLDQVMMLSLFFNMGLFHLFSVYSNNSSILSQEGKREK